jgi:hypothetical protein
MCPVHVRADPGDFAESVLLPGDPLRAKYIAETFFEDAKLVTEERGMLGYTGTYRGKPVSVQATGMGCPSASIVTEELIQLGVKNLLRVGTCGGYSRKLRGSHRHDLCCPAGRNGLLDHPRRPLRPGGPLRRCPRRPPRGREGGAKDFRRPGSQLRPVLRPYRRPCDIVGRPRDSRRRDGGCGDLHHSRNARCEGGMPADRLRHHRR